jgi:hypothetical protein
MGFGGSRLSVVIAASVLVVTVRTSSVWAQDEIDEARKSARLHLGGVYLTPTVQIKEFGLDSNVFNAAGEGASDFTATFSPGADIAVPFARRALITGHADTDLVYYQKYANQRSVNPNVSLRATGFFHRLSVFTEGTYLNTHQRVNQEIDARARRTDEGLQAGFDLRLLPKLSATMSGRIGRLDYAGDQFFRDVNLRESLAEDSRSVAVAIRYRATPLTTLVIRGDAGQERFLFATVKDTDSYRVMPGVELKPRALISGSAYVGFRRFQPLNPLVPEYRGAVAAASLRYLLQSATAFTLTIDRDVQYSFQELNPYYIGTGVGVGVRRQLAGSFDATAGVQRFQYAYQDLLTSPVHLETPRVDITRNYSGDVGYRFGRKGRLGVGLSYWIRDSNRATEVAYSGLRFGSTVTYGF